MSRTVPEWKGASDDTKIPQRVKLRVAERQDEACAKCRCPLTDADCDHIIPLILGGENRETNLQMLCGQCHKNKTKLDVKLRAKSDKIRAKRLLKREQKYRWPKRSLNPPRYDNTKRLEDL